MNELLTNRLTELLEMLGAHLPDLFSAVLIAVTGFLLAYLSNRLIRAW